MFRLDMPVTGKESFSPCSRFLLLQMQSAKDWVPHYRKVKKNPYQEHNDFFLSIASIIESNDIPLFFIEICKSIKREREAGISNIHVLRNCPIDDFIPELNPENPVLDKYEKKKSYVGEAFLALFSFLVRTPLLAYKNRHNSDFFTDVIAIKRYSGQLTGFSDSELVYHNDRTVHEIRADFITLLGLRCPEEDLVFTGFIDGRNLLAHLTSEEQAILRQPYFITRFDVYSRDTNKDQIQSKLHAILENHYSFRYLDTMTSVAPNSPFKAKDGLIALKNALSLAERVRHRILTGDLLAFANQNGLHNREKIEVKNPHNMNARWLLKTYAFRNSETANRYKDRWADGVYGRVSG